MPNHLTSPLVPGASYNQTSEPEVPSCEVIGL